MTGNNGTNSGPEKEGINLKMGKVDMNSIIDMYKKNLEILSLVNQMSFDVYKSVAKLQSTFIQQMITDACSACKNTKPTDAMYKFAELARDNMTNAVNNGKQISEILTSSGNDISGVLTKRFKESIDDMKKAYSK